MDEVILETARPTGEQLDIVHHIDDRFYELLIDKKFGGLIVYGRFENRVVFTHTYIEESHRGQGLARLLIEGVLDDVKAQNGTITNFCPIIDQWIRSHPVYAELIDPRDPGRWPREDHPTEVA